MPMWWGVGGALVGALGNSGDNSTTTQNTVPPEFSGLASDVGTMGRQFANLPYQPYPYAQVAPFNPYQYMGFDMTANQEYSLSPETVAQLLQARQAQLQQAVPVAHTVDIAWRVGDQRTLVLSTMLLPPEDQLPTLDVWIIPDLDGLSAFAIRSLHNIEWRILRLAHTAKFQRVGVGSIGNRPHRDLDRKSVV